MLIVGEPYTETPQQLDHLINRDHHIKNALLTRKLSQHNMTSNKYHLIQYYQQ
mgnify:CR=1 FL=1